MLKNTALKQWQTLGIDIGGAVMQCPFPTPARWDHGTARTAAKISRFAGFQGHWRGTAWNTVKPLGEAQRGRALLSQCLLQWHHCNYFWGSGWLTGGLPLGGQALRTASTLKQVSSNHWGMFPPISRGAGEAQPGI